MSVREAILRLRADALARGMDALAIIYGWSAIRLGCDRLDEIEAQVLRAKAEVAR